MSWAVLPRQCIRVVAWDLPRPLHCREGGYGLWFAFIKKLEIALCQMADRLSVLIAHDNRDQHKIDFALECRDRFLCQRQCAAEYSKRRDAAWCRA
jgi:hypothetical protein